MRKADMFVRDIAPSVACCKQFSSCLCLFFHNSGRLTADLIRKRTSRRISCCAAADHHRLIMYPFHSHPPHLHHFYHHTTFPPKHQAAAQSLRSRFAVCPFELYILFRNKTVRHPAGMHSPHRRRKPKGLLWANFLIKITLHSSLKLHRTYYVPHAVRKVYHEQNRVC